MSFNTMIDFMNKGNINKCVLCNGNIKKSGSDIIICNDCVIKNKYFITHTDAKKQYFVNDKELESLVFLERKNRMYGSVTYKLYFIEDIKKCAMKKFKCDTLEELTDIIEKRKLKLKTKRDIKAETVNERRNNLSDALQKVGLELRKDSFICDDFIKNNNCSIPVIVETMLGMDFLHKNTSYDLIIRESPHDHDVHHYKYKFEAIKKYVKKHGEKSIALLPEYLQTIYYKYSITE